MGSPQVYRVTGVNPALPDVPGIEVVRRIEELRPGFHTLTLYVGPQRSNALAQSVLGYGFARVIFNPGAENAALEQQLRDANVEVLEACTLVMLAAGQF